MSRNYVSLWYHLVWGTKHRRPFLDKRWRGELYRHIQQYCRYKRYHLDCINGVDDHIHLLISIKPSITIGDVVRNIKKSSYFWVQEHIPDQEDFGWQNGYGAFSVGHRHLPALRKYIHNQEKHHQSISAEQEYQKLCE